MRAAFRDRVEAGQFLAPLLRAYARRDDTLVLGVGRGGAGVAFEVACRLRAPLDVLIVRNLRVPRHPDLMMGALVSGGVVLREEAVLSDFAISAAAFDEVARREQTQLDRETRRCRGTRPGPEIEDKIVLLVADGIETGSTMRAAVRAVELKRPRSVTVAAPVASARAVAALKNRVAGVVTVLAPEQPFSLADYYGDRVPPTEAEVALLLTRAAARAAIPHVTLC